MSINHENLFQLLRLNEHYSACKKTYRTTMPEEKKFNDIVVDHAALSVDVYFDWPVQPIRGWYRFKDTNRATSTGYYGAVYIDSAEDPRHAIIAHRGSKGFADFIADIAILKRKTFEQLNDAGQFSAEAENNLYKSFRKTVIVDGQGPREESREEFDQRFMISHAGHSLGAVLAEFCGISHLTCTFENPGTKEIWVDYMNNIPNLSQETKLVLLNEVLSRAKKYFSVIQSHVNMINCCNSQIGSVFRMIDMPYEYDGLSKNELAYPFQVASSWMMNNFYVGSYTLHQHKIELITEYLYSGGKVVPDSSPAGFEEGYIEFLDTGKNWNFWRGYFEYM